MLQAFPSVVIPFATVTITVTMNIAAAFMLIRMYVRT